MLCKRVLPVIALSLIFAPLTWGSADAQVGDPAPCYVSIFSQGSVEIDGSECSSIVLGEEWWGALSPGLVNVFLRAIDLSVSVESGGGFIVDMDQEETAAFWSPISPVAAAEREIACPHRESVWISTWTVDLGRLEAGEYHVDVAFASRHAFYDGMQHCTYLGEPVGHPKYGPGVFYVGGFPLIIE